MTERNNRKSEKVTQKEKLKEKLAKKGINEINLKSTEMMANKFTRLFA